MSTHIYIYRSTGCIASKNLFDRSNALQNFIHDLFWPDEVFASHLEQRLKLMACDMIEDCVCHTLAAFQQWERKGSRWAGTDYIIPTEMCTMINVVLEAKNQSLKLCTFHGHDTVWIWMNQWIFHWLPYYYELPCSFRFIYILFTYHRINIMPR